MCFFFFSSRRRHTRLQGDWSSDVCSSDLFFEVKNAPTFQVPAGIPDPRKAQFDHLSFNLPDEDSLHALQRRLKEHGSEVTDVIDHGVVRSIYFNDPHGIALEASWWARDATGRPADYADDGFFADPDPVP